MTKTGSFSRTMRTVLLATVLMPAPLLAEPAASPRQLLALAQSKAQDHAVKGEVEKMTNRDLSLTERASVASAGASTVDRPAAIPSIAASRTEASIETPSQPAPIVLRDDAVPVPQVNIAEAQPDSRLPPIQVASVSYTEMPLQQVNTPSAVVPPAPATAADTPRVAPAAVAIAPSHDSAAAAVAPMPVNATTSASKITSVAQGNTIAAKPESRSATESNVARKSENSEAVVKPVVRTAPASARIANTSPATHQRLLPANTTVEFDDRDIRHQLGRIANRPELRALMAQYGLN
jgi:hypothetical protein